MDLPLNKLKVEINKLSQLIDKLKKINGYYHYFQE